MSESKKGKDKSTIKKNGQGQGLETNLDEEYSEFVLDGVISEKVDNYNDFVLSKRKAWRIPENELKVYIIKNSLIPHKCKLCNMKPEWRGKPLELILDRINNQVLDNELENLRFLCPNCMAQTKKNSTIFEKSMGSKMVKCQKCQKRIKYKTFSVNKSTNIEQLCTQCLKQERLEMFFINKKEFPKDLSTSAYACKSSDSKTTSSVSSMYNKSHQQTQSKTKTTIEKEI